MMKDRGTLADQDETPEDVATLYSWANLHGAKYRDFSASRAQTRETARLRVQQAIEQDRERAREEAEALKTAEAQHAAEASKAAEAARALEAQRRQQQERDEAARLAAEQTALATEQAALMAEQTARQRASQQREPNPIFTYAAPVPAPLPVGYSAAVSNNAGRVVEPSRSAAAPSFAPSPAYMPVQAPVSALAAGRYPAAHQERHTQPQSQWISPDSRETLGHPAWLASERGGLTAEPVPPAPEDTIQGSRERLASRWFALNGVFNEANVPADAAPAKAAPSVSAPVLAVFSLAGGVGKTSLIATLGRALSSRGERVLLVDTAPYGLLPFFFGARDQRPGSLRTFTPPGASSDAPIQMITLDAEAVAPSDRVVQDPLTAEILKLSSGAGRVMIDLATASGATTRRVLRLAPTILVPVVPDMNSVVSVSSIDSFFQHNPCPNGKQVMPFYVLNQFDPSLPLHLDVREVLREQLGDRMLPFALRRTPVVSEALAEGMTAMDYAPNSSVAEDFGNLAGWVKSLAAPANTGFRGVRWSER